jgi:hypothetical protein
MSLNPKSPILNHKHQTLAGHVVKARESKGPFRAEVPERRGKRPGRDDGRGWRDGRGRVRSGWEGVFWRQVGFRRKTSLVTCFSDFKSSQIKGIRQRSCESLCVFFIFVGKKRHLAVCTLGVTHLQGMKHLSHVPRVSRIATALAPKTPPFPYTAALLCPFAASCSRPLTPVSCSHASITVKSDGASQGAPMPSNPPCVLMGKSAISRLPTSNSRLYLLST